MSTLDSLFINTCMVISLAYVVSLTYQDWRTAERRSMVLLRTLLCSGGAILLMFHGITIGDDIQVDVRAVPIVLLMLRYGIGYGLIAIAPVLITRVIYFPVQNINVYAMSLLLTFILLGLIRSRMPDGRPDRRSYMVTPLLVFSVHTLPVLLSPVAGWYFSHVFIWYFLANVIGFYLSAQILMTRIEYLKATEHLRQEALSDPLTGLLNRRQFEKDRARFSTGDAFLLLDLDHFKQVNDRHGHAMGDEVLRQLAALLKSSTRDNDRLYRMGGEEFLVVLRGIETQQAITIAERIRETVEHHVFPVPERITVSGGLVQFSTPGNLNQLLEQGDHLLYRAKREGRNRIKRELRERLDPQM
ncbi:diguanylate cyclase [Deinococcus cellulosilyticus]|uniref:GGDEF domain-containing protein n=1 Tax=Deinococcus cellulosilyticus (strain DSM 18568 / NBRC 106333 / KACC 11606 / 5516J-15) TaxID=1223518 RepID=A0A511MW87_DEIC1|nr:diguanylate cyclase [Deinococcus cellulosilyticus]GEM44386.1 GGDEF domain-containing protein [Deinococcus cellulosilyticus NBRC 106333 = KACC 11606]